MKSVVTHSNVCIIGLGQLGGSLGLALRKAGARRVHGVALDEETITQAKEIGAIHDGTVKPEEALSDADITFLCTPLDASVEFVKNNIDSFRFGSVVTDIGSVKGSIIRELRGLLFEKGVYFVGSHPMAGSEKTGLAHASEGMYENVTCFLTPTDEDDEEVLRILHGFWGSVGCNVLELDAARHDQACAFASHMLHMIAAVAVQSILGEGDIDANHFACAGGFRDHTRIASSDTAMWVEVSKHNREAILAAMDVYSRQFKTIEKAIDESDWTTLEATLVSAKATRDAWSGSAERDQDH